MGTSVPVVLRSAGRGAVGAVQARATGVGEEGDEASEGDGAMGERAVGTGPSPGGVVACLEGQKKCR